MQASLLWIGIVTIVTWIPEPKRRGLPQLMEEHTSRWDAPDKTAPLSGPCATGVERSPVARAVCNSGAPWLGTPSYPVTSSIPALSFLSRLSFDITPLPVAPSHASTASHSDRRRCPPDLFHTTSTASWPYSKAPPFLATFYLPHTIPLLYDSATRLLAPRAHESSGETLAPKSITAFGALVVLIDK